MMAPKLRFPEFGKEPTWSERKLSEVLKEHGSKSTGEEQVFSVSVHKGIINQIEHLGRSFSAATTDHYKRVFPGDVVYTKSPTGDFPLGIIKQSKITKSVIVSPLYGVFTPETNALGCILDAYFESAGNTINYLSSIVQKGAKNTINISNETFLSKALFLPANKEEQQKIAAFLTSLDDLITAQNEKIKALQAHKKGLMQQLFPAEGETLPRVRFREFEGSGEWEEKRIEDLAIRGSGHTPNKSQPSYYNGGIKWVSLADSNRLDKGYIYETKAEISIEGLKNSSAVLHPSGTVIVSRDAGVGKSAVLYSEMAVSQHFIVWRCDKSKLLNWFLYFFLQIIKPKLERIASGSTIKTIGLPYFKEMCITIPSIQEQQKIADCLSSLDDLITAQSQKLEALKMQKKGLMQQMFPNPNEIEA